MQNLYNLTDAEFAHKCKVYEAAKEYIARGFAVIPVHCVKDNGECTCGDLTCKAKGKHPKFNGWQKGWSRDLAQIEAWFGENFPHLLNIGIATGGANGIGYENGIDAVDLDLHDPNANGIEALRQIVGEKGFPQTLKQRTPRYGVHLIFKASGLKSLTHVAKEFLKKKYTGIDIRGDGGYIVVAPSRVLFEDAFVEYKWLTAEAIADFPSYWREIFLKNDFNENPKSKDGKPETPEEFLAKNLISWAGFSETYFERKQRCRGAERYKTSIVALDSILYGGWQPRRLHFIGGNTGIGKTAFVLQTAMASARAGYDVLFFALEMDAEDIFDRLSSRFSWDLANAKLAKGERARGLPTNAFATGGAMVKSNAETGAVAQFFADHEQIMKANDGILKNLHVIENVAGGRTIESIRKIIEMATKFAGGDGDYLKPPLVIVDYFQLIASSKIESDKQRVDAAAMELKQIAKDFQVPVVAVSSLNRDGYYAPVELKSFKESGAIEYTADVLLALQYFGCEGNEKGVGGTDLQKRKDFAQAYLDFKTAKNRPPYFGQIELKVLKNRFGDAGGRIPLWFSSSKNIFCETEPLHYANEPMEEFYSMADEIVTEPNGFGNAF